MWKCNQWNFYYPDYITRITCKGRAVPIKNRDLIFFHTLQIAVSSELTSSPIANKAPDMAKEKNEGEKGELLSSKAGSSTGPGRLRGVGNRITGPSNLLSLAGQSSLPLDKWRTNPQMFTS